MGGGRGVHPHRPQCGQLDVAARPFGGADRPGQPEPVPWEQAAGPWRRTAASGLPGGLQEAAAAAGCHWRQWRADPDRQPPRRNPGDRRYLAWRREWRPRTALMPRAWPRKEALEQAKKTPPRGGAEERAWRDRKEKP